MLIFLSFDFAIFVRATFRPLLVFTHAAIVKPPYNFLPIRKIFRIFKYSPLFEIRLLSIRTDWATSFITGGKFAAPPPLQAIGGNLTLRLLVRW